ncbi:Vitamin B6 photo-protection and homoeostasis [Lotmaria passim]
MHAAALCRRAGLVCASQRASPLFQRRPTFAFGAPAGFRYGTAAASYRRAAMTWALPLSTTRRMKSGVCTNAGGTTKYEHVSGEGSRPSEVARTTAASGPPEAGLSSHAPTFSYVSSSMHLYRSLHTKATMPKTDGSGLTLCFSQGMTDYCWRDLPGAPHVRSPSVLHRETIFNHIRLFGMPKGFPETTAEGFQSFFYLSQASSFVSNFASSIGFQSLLSGFFLASSPQLWMLKDLIPALLAAYMANRVVSYENRPKFWFCVSVFMTNVTVISDMVIPSAVPSHLLAAAILTSTVKQSASLMFFVTRAAALQHYAINNNLAELTKKFNSFGIVNYTIATALGIVYCSLISSFIAQLVTVIACCVTNMYLSSKSMTPITFRLLNFGTMYLLLRAYLKEAGRIMTPQEVSDLLGVRMSPLIALKEAGVEVDVATELIYISPPIDKLLIRSDALDEDVLYLNDNRMFMLAMWKPAPLPLTLRDRWRRHELPSLPDFIRQRGWRRADPRVAEMERRFHSNRLCLLVHHKCTAKDLVTAYLIMYSAVLLHATTEEELRAFIRACHMEQAAWHKKGAAFREQLDKANWDVQLPALDHPNYRMSELIIPPCMRSKSSSPILPANGAAIASA